MFAYCKNVHVFEQKLCEFKKYSSIYFKCSQKITLNLKKCSSDQKMFANSNKSKTIHKNVHRFKKCLPIHKNVHNLLKNVRKIYYLFGI